MACSVCPKLLDELRLGHVDTAEAMLRDSLDEIRLYPVFDIFVCFLLLLEFVAPVF